MTNMTNHELERALPILFTDATVLEIRILTTNKGVVSGYFDNGESIAKSIAPYVGKCSIFCTLNEVDPSLFNRSPNMLTEFASSSTKDTDILRYRFLMVDVDPVRPSNVSASEEEREAARPIVEEIRQELKRERFPDPVICSSGNGFHILIKVDLDVTPESTALVRRFLNYLDLRYSTDKVHIDTCVYKAAQLTKLYGTLACKGEASEERPHRMSKILKSPDVIRNAPIELIRKIANQAPTSGGKGLKPEKGIVVKDWLVKNRLELHQTKPYSEDGELYVLKTCPWNHEHTNHSAYVIQFKNGAIAAGCHHESCKGKGWTDLKALYPSEEVGERTGNQGQTVKQSKKIIELSAEDIHFEDEDGVAYSAVEINGHLEVISMKSKDYKYYLTKRYLDANQSIPSSEAIKEALLVNSMKARYSHKSYSLKKRVAAKDDCLYYDLCNSNWEAVKISDGQVTIDHRPPILFTRTKGMQEQVLPNLSVTSSELLPLLRKHLRFKTELDLNLFAVYLVTCLVADIPHPILVLSGEHGAAKSTSLRMLQRIVDPSSKDLLTMPRRAHELAIILNNCYMPVFDNLSTLSLELSNMLCMASTGGGFSKRELYSDVDEVVLSLKRCAVLNGVNFAPTQSDLLDRSILIELDRIANTERKSERKIWHEFGVDLPRILGACFQALAAALKCYDESNIDETGRMADFCYYGYAVAEALGIGGTTFLNAYTQNRLTANEQALESHPVATAVVAFMRDKTEHTTSVSGLLNQLEVTADLERVDTRSKLWPKEANWLSRRLKDVKSNLSEVGITYEIRPNSDFKEITLYKVSGGNEN